MVKSLFKKFTLMALMTFITFSIFQCQAPTGFPQPNVHWAGRRFFNGVLVSTSPNIQINFTRIYGKQYDPDTNKEDKEALAKHGKGILETTDGEVIEVYFEGPRGDDVPMSILECSKSVSKKRKLSGTLRCWSDEDLSIELEVSVDNFFNWEYRKILFKLIPNVVNS